MSSAKKNKKPIVYVSDLLGYKLKKTQHRLRLHMDEVLKPLGLTTPQYAVLAQLELRPGISNAELSRAAFIQPQTMHAMVTHLEKANCIKRKAHPQHGRILSAELTDAGYALVQKAHAAIVKVEAQMTHSMSQANKTLFEALLLECFDNLNVATKTPRTPIDLKKPKKA